MYEIHLEEVRFPLDLEKTIGPRGVIKSWATDKDDPTEQPRWGRVGKQKIEDTGPLNRKRMETCDDEFVNVFEGLPISAPARRRLSLVSQ